MVTPTSLTRADAAARGGYLPYAGHGGHHRASMSRLYGWASERGCLDRWVCVEVGSCLCPELSGPETHSAAWRCVCGCVPALCRAPAGGFVLATVWVGGTVLSLPFLG